MKSYRIKEYSPYLFFVVFLFFLLASFIFFIYIYPNIHSVLTFLSLSVIMGVAIYLANLISTADIEITLNNNGLKKKWLKKFIFQNDRDIEIKWSEMEDYVFEPERFYDTFTIKLKNGVLFSFHHNQSHDSKDDFQKFLLEFNGKVNEVNSSTSNETYDIKPGKTIYEGASGIVLGILSVITIIGIPIVLFVLKSKNEPNYYIFAFFVLSALFYLVQVFRHIKLRKKRERVFR